jgi:hydroxyacyl-ACP dehydratase HTD2-like protein with hotdog domain
MNINTIQVGDQLPVRELECDTVQLFQYNAALWNAHRIHFDFPYATEEEGYPGLVVAGPLLGDWLSQCVIEWLGDSGRLASIEYSNRRAAYVGDLLRVGGCVTSVDRESGTVDLALFVRNEAGDNITPGNAVVELVTA